MTRSEVIDKIGNLIREIARVPDDKRFGQDIKLRWDLKMDGDQYDDLLAAIMYGFDIDHFVSAEKRWVTMRNVVDEVCERLEIAE